MKNETIKVKKGALIGRYFKTLKQAQIYYETKMSKELRKHQSIIQFKSGECMIVGNSTIHAIKK